MKNEDKRKEAEFIQDTPFNIPAESAAPSTMRPKHRPEEENFADDEDIAKKTVDAVKNYYMRFAAQDSREVFKKNMDISDELWRAAADRTRLNSDETANTKTTGSNVRTASFYADIRTISAFESSVVLGDRRDIPVKYAPNPDAEEFVQDEGERVSEEQNAVLAWAFDEDQMWKKLSRIITFTNKYAGVPIEMGWAYQTDKRLVREPTRWEEKGGRLVPVKFKEKEKVIVTKDCPELLLHDNNDFFTDCDIDDIRNQSCVIILARKQLADLYNLQATGQIVNVAKVAAKHALGLRQTYGDDAREDRRLNAGETAREDTASTLVDIFSGYIRIPVEDGKWDDKKNVPQYHKFIFAGTPEGPFVPLLIQPNRFGNCIPIAYVTSHDDDKGLYHDGYVQRVKSLLAQEMTTYDQIIDCWTKRNNAPLLAYEGSILNRKKEFTDGRNPIWWIRQGAQLPTSFKVEDTTHAGVPLLDSVRAVRYQIMGINKTMRGEEMGSRTSAGEALTVFEMARKPAYEDIIYKGDQLLTFVAYWIKEFTRAYMDPQTCLHIKYDGHFLDVFPGNLYGELKTQVVFVKQFEDSLVSRREEDTLMRQILPLMNQLQILNKQGASKFFKGIFKRRGMEDMDEIVGTRNNFDAERNAKMENLAIVYQGEYDMPEPGEDNETHLKQHEPFMQMLELLPPDQKPTDQNMQILRMHIARTKQLQAADEQQQQMPQQGQEQPMEGQQPMEQGAEARTEGEAMGDMMGAQAGMEQGGVPM